MARGTVRSVRTYEFERRWTTPAPTARVQQVLVDLEHYPQWWPQVVAVAKIDDDTARVLCRSALPYTLDLVLHAQRREPTLLVVGIGGALEGWARFDLHERGAVTEVAYTQRVVVAHWGLAAASVLTRPLMRWNHDHMMAGWGECRAGRGAPPLFGSGAGSRRPSGGRGGGRVYPAPGLGCTPPPWGGGGGAGRGARPPPRMTQERAATAAS